MRRAALIGGVLAALAPAACDGRAVTMADGGAADAVPGGVADAVDAASRPREGVGVATLSAARAGYFLALDETHLYFTTPGSVQRLLKAGGPATLVAAAAGEFHALAIDATHVYFTESDLGNVKRTPKGGGDVVTLATGQKWASGVAVDEARVYWATGDGTVRAVAQAGGPTQTLAGPTEVGGTERGLHALVVDGSNVYLATTSRLLRIPKLGGTPVVLADQAESHGPIGLAADEGYLYWVGVGHGVMLDDTHYTYPHGRVLRVAKGGGAVQPLASEVLWPQWIAVDKTHLYWTSIASDGQLLRLAKGGGAPSVVADAPLGMGLALDEQHIYWSSASRIAVAHK